MSFPSPAALFVSLFRLPSSFQADAALAQITFLQTPSVAFIQSRIPCNLISTTPNTREYSVNL